MSQLLQYYKSFNNRNAAQTNMTPTFEDLSIDDNLTELQRLVKYAKSSIGLQRLVHVKMLASITATTSFEVSANQIIPIIGLFALDTEPAIRLHLVEQLVPIALQWVNSSDEKLYRLVLEHLLPVTAKLLEDIKPEVRTAAVTSLVEISQLIKPDHLGQYVLTIILRLAHEDDKEELRMTACELLNMLAECLGYDLCKQFVIVELVSLAEDPVFRVRKSAALNFHNICKVGGEHELFERLMPAFVRLSKDDMYRVRKACAESLYEISKFVGDDIRIGVLVEIFLRLTQDPSKLVRQSVLQVSGMFISTLPPRSTNEVVLSHFLSMVYEPTGDVNVDVELKHHCAFSFPGVVLTIGGNRWKEVREHYMALVQSRNPAVKQTLAASLHEIARILGDQHVVEEELVPVFEDMIQDVEEVQMGVIKNLAVFLSLLSEPCRVSYLPILHDIMHSTNPFNWRLRQALALQLPQLLDLPPRQDIYSMLFPLVMTLLQDPVASVRTVTYKGVSKMISLLHEQFLLESASNPDNIAGLRSAQDLDSVIKTINSLVQGEIYHLRQLWVELCHQLLRDLPKDLFEQHFIGGILLLACDPVSNVRIAVAQLLSGWAPDPAPWDPPGDSQWRWFLQRSDIRECVGRLSRDDYDVFYAMSKLQQLFPEIEFIKISCRGKKIPPGGSVPIVLSSSIDSSVEHVMIADEIALPISTSAPLPIPAVNLSVSDEESIVPPPPIVTHMSEQEQLLVEVESSLGPEVAPVVISYSPPKAPPTSVITIDEDLLDEAVEPAASLPDDIDEGSPEPDGDSAVINELSDAMTAASINQEEDGIISIDTTDNLVEVFDESAVPTDDSQSTDC